MKNTLNKVKIIIGGLILLSNVSVSFLQSQGRLSETEFILDKLVEKGIIENYESQEIRNQISNQYAEKIKKEKEEQDKKKKEDKFKIKTSGYLQIKYSIDEKTKAKDPLVIRRARVKFSRLLDKWIEFSMTPDFAGVTSGSNVSMKGVFVNIMPIESFSIKVGQDNQPFGFENNYSSSKKKFDDAPYYMKNVLTDDYDYGVFLTYKQKLYSATVSALNGTTKATEDNIFKDISAKATFNPMKNIETGISHYYRYSGTSTVVEGNHSAVYVKLEDKKPLPYFFVAEYVFGKDSKIKHDCYNLIATAEVTLLNLLAPTVRYEIWDPDTSKSDNEITVYTVGVNIYPNKYTRFLVDYRIKQETPSVKDDKINFMVQVSF